ncbi:hypothetical protein BKA65DRAFT_88252 [Rhexocercosporidium sp. MPI-PUGE-AT-0058]|nr:hypothetical protein BKA65DRAFT_88252 [Rhexocercosporidium sp. MPI-PUGE-AT-0058]
MDTIRTVLHGRSKHKNISVGWLGNETLRLGKIRGGLGDSVLAWMAWHGIGNWIHMYVFCHLGKFCQRKVKKRKKDIQTIDTILLCVCVLCAFSSVCLSVSLTFKMDD